MNAKRAVVCCLVILGACSDSPQPRPKDDSARSMAPASPREVPASSPSSDDGGVVIKGKASPKEDRPAPARSAEEEERIKKLQASAHASQGRGTGGKPVPFKKAGKARGSSEWTESLADAVGRAKSEHRLVLAFFTGSDWCGWCKKLVAEVFSTGEFKDWAAENVVLLEVDFPKEKPQTDELKAQNAQMAKNAGIRGYPTVLFFDEAGKSYGSLGYMEGGPSAWTAKAQAIVDTYK